MLEHREMAEGRNINEDDIYWKYCVLTVLYTLELSYSTYNVFKDILISALFIIAKSENNLPTLKHWINYNKTANIALKKLMTWKDLYVKCKSKKYVYYDPIYTCISGKTNIGFLFFICT